MKKSLLAAITICSIGLFANAQDSESGCVRVDIGGPKVFGFGGSQTRCNLVRDEASIEVPKIDGFVKWTLPTFSQNEAQRYQFHSDLEGGDLKCSIQITTINSNIKSVTVPKATVETYLQLSGGDKGQNLRMGGPSSTDSQTNLAVYCSRTNRSVRSKAISLEEVQTLTNGILNLQVK